MTSVRHRWVLIPLGLVGLAALAAPADQLPVPRPERCIPFDPELLGDKEIAAPAGLDYTQVRSALRDVLPTALHCGQPEGFDAIQLTFELVVGCDGVVATIELTDDDGVPPAYGTCVGDVISRADFPAHDMENGMPITYPVNVSW